MAEFQPPPTYADVVLIDERTKRASFNPIWLKWFIDLSANLGPGGAGTVTSVAMSGGTTGLTTAGGPVTTSGTFTLGGTLVTANGGTGFSSYAVGDLIYAGTTTTFSKLADVATGNALIAGGVSTAPSWGKIALTTHVTGTLPVANGGTGVTASTGSVAVVLSTSPVLVTPTLGVAAATSINFGTTALSVYTEGTWTISVAFGGSSTGVTSSTAVGDYTKIGNRTLFAGRLVLTSNGSATGTATVTGLPFAATSTTFSPPRLNLTGAAATATQPQALIINSESVVRIYNFAAGSLTQYTDTDITDTTTLYIAGQYI